MPPARRLLVLLLFVPWLAACAPYLAPRGPEPGTAEIVELPLGQLRFRTADGYSLLMRGWLPEGPPSATILALHGFNDHSTFIETAAKAWAEAGIATYAYDQRGFGTSPNRGLWAGSEVYAGDTADALRLLAERHPGAPVYLLGESMGGAIALATLARHPEAPAAGTILAAPAVWSRATMPFYQRFSLMLASYTVPWFPLSASGLDIQASDNIEVLRELGTDPLVIKETRVDAVHGLADLMDEAMAAAESFEAPALLLYGAKDELVPEEPMLGLWRRLPAEARDRQRQAFYEDGWHLLFRDLGAETVIADVVAWIASPDTPLPSGADLAATARLTADAE